MNDKRYSPTGTAPSAMDTTIRNLDAQLYRRLKARAALEDKTVGEAMNDAMRGYLARRGEGGTATSLADLEPVSYGEGSERLSEELDGVLYVAERGEDA